MVTTGQTADDVDSGRRAQVLRLAAGLFALRGIAGTPMSDIAEAAGIKKASLYYFFASKEQLVFDALLPGVEAPYRGLLPVVHSNQPPAAKFIDGMRLLGRQFDTLPDVMQILVRERLENHLTEESFSHIQRFKGLYTDLWTVLLQEGIESKAFKPTNEKIAVFATLGALNWMYAWFSPSGPMTGEQLAEAMAGMLLDGLAS